MFKNILGPKKMGGHGEAVEPTRLREALLELFPIDGELNKHLEIKPNKDSADGFIAEWVLYVLDSDENAYFRWTQFISADIQPKDHCVKFNIWKNIQGLSIKAQREMKQQGIPVYDDDVHLNLIRVGTLEELKLHDETRNKYKALGWHKVPKKETDKVAPIRDLATLKKRIQERLTTCVTSLGWDVIF